MLKPIEWKNNAVRIIDQTQLPTALVYENITSVKSMWTAIKQLKVRGAPLIGVSAAYGLFAGLQSFPDHGAKKDFIRLLEKEAAYLATSRPTAVNLFWALNRMADKGRSLVQSHTIAQVKKLLLQEAHTILREDIAMGRKIGEYGFDLLKKCDVLYTHCNAGGLATGRFGTALAPVYIGKQKGKTFSVYADETRPLLQGARITAFELMAAKVPVTVVCDNMAAMIMSTKKVDAVIVGADRIASNGDTANKIGTYGLALIAKAHNVPFYVAAPFSTFDLSIDSGKKIPIEERHAQEIVCGFGKQTAPIGVKVFNPAFDVTPGKLITAIITERGVLRQPFTKTIRKAAQNK